MLPEPIHFDLVTEDETVVDAIPVIGYVHRGLEKLVEKKDFQEFVYVAERICGICGFMHGFGYCQAVEQVMGIEVPERAQYLRTIWAELSRIHSHLLWLGVAADAMGFESLFMHSFRVREHVLNLIEPTAGGRMIFGCVKVGGVRRDIPADMLRHFVTRLRELEPEIREITDVFLKDYSVEHRLRGWGSSTKEEAYELGGRAHAQGERVAQDIRKIGYAAYKDLALNRWNGRGLLRTVRGEGEGDLRIDRPDPAVGGKDPGRPGRGQGERETRGRVLRPDRTAPGGGHLLREGKREQIPGAVSGEGPHLRQPARDGQDAQRGPDRGRADPHCHR